MNEETIFSKAVLIDSPPERDKFLAQACAGDPRMLAKVRQLLSLHEEAGSFLENPPVSPAVEPTVVAGDTHDGPVGSTSVTMAAFPNVDLSFLSPSKKPGCLGTIGQYEVTGVIGEGGMGLVLKALDTKLHRTVALKFLAPQLAANGNARKRFLREAVAAAAVVHPHVVTIHAVDEGPVPFLVMEYVSGVSLREKLDRSGALDIKEILRIGSQIAAGLAAAHHQGLIHRDIKPGNILLENGVQRVKITDFGLARAADDLSVTRTGEVSGTPQYMSPEQARGDQIDQRSDLFSMGSVLYAMCTGRAPFRADTTMGVLKRVCEDEPRPIRELNREIPDWLEGIVGKLLEKDPKNRFQTAAEVADVLSQALAHVQQPTQVSRPAYRPAIRGGSGLPIWLTALLVILAGPFLIGASMLVVRVFGTALHYFTGAEAAIVIRHPMPEPEQGASSAGPGQVNASRPDSSHAVSDVNRPPLAVLPFDANAAARHQQVWADYLGVPVEFTNSFGITFRLIPPGDFMMGEGVGHIEENKALAADDAYWNFIIDSSGPVHRVKVTQPYYMATTEVTNDQFRKVVDKSQLVTSGERLHPNDRNWRKMAEGTSPNSPVGYLTWGDSAEFCRALSKLEGVTVELPTEAQWEYACRAGSNSRWCYGDDPLLLPEYAWFDQPNPGTIAEVGGRKPNAFGLHDMHGNISEWCRDWHQRDFYARSPVEDPYCSDEFKSPDVRSQVLRGGRWLDKAPLVSSACPRHYSFDINNAYPDYGFRPVIVGDLRAVARSHAATATGPASAAVKIVDAAKLDGHAKAIDGLAASQDGRYLFSAGQEGAILQWDVQARSLVRRIPCDGVVTGLATLPDADQLVVAFFSGEVSLWSIKEGRKLRDLTKYTDQATSMAVLPFGEQIVSASYDGTVRLTEVATGTSLIEMKDDFCFAVALSRDGKLAAHASAADIVIWKANTGAVTKRIHRAGDAVFSLAFSPDGTRLVSGSGNREIQVWDVESGKQVHRALPSSSDFGSHPTIPLAPGERFQSRIRDIQFLGSSNLFVASADDRTLRLFDVASGKQISERHNKTQCTVRLAMLPDLETFATAGGWALKRGTDGNFEPVGDGDNSVRLWRIDQPGPEQAAAAQPRQLQLAGEFRGGPLDDEHGVFALEVTRDGSKVVTGHFGGRLAVWDVASCRETKVIDAHEATIQGLVLTADGQVAATSAEDGTVRLWDLESGQRLQEYVGHDKRVDGLALFDSADLLITAGADFQNQTDRSLFLWDINGGAKVDEIKTDVGIVIDVAALDDKIAALTTSPGRLSLWNPTTHALLNQVPLRSPISLAWSPVSGTFAVGHAVEAAESQTKWDNNECVVTLLDAGTLKEKTTLTGHRSPVVDVDFTPDGEQVVSVSGGAFIHTGAFLEGADSTIRVWDAATGREIARGESDDRLLRVASLPDGRRFVTGGNRHLRLWALSLED